MSAQFSSSREGAGSVLSQAVWSLGAFSGRLAEVSGGPASAVLTLTFRLVLEAQKLGEPAAWITARGSSFLPSDAADSGVDLGALAVIRVPQRRPARCLTRRLTRRLTWCLAAGVRVADHLLRSGGFGLVVLDLGPGAHMPMPIQARLAGLVRKHRAALLCLTEKSSEISSLGPLFSLRVEAIRTKAAAARFGCEARVLKDKRGSDSGRSGCQHGTHVVLEACRGPDGLC